MVLLLDNKSEEYKIFKLIGENYDILMALFPDKSFYLNKMATNLGFDLTKLSRKAVPLEDADLINVREEKGKRGKPPKIVNLTNIAYRLLSDNQNYLQAKSKIARPIDPNYINNFITYFKSKDIEIRDIAIDQVGSITNQRIVPIDCEFITYLRDIINLNEFKDKKYNILLIIKNIILVSQKENLYTLEKIYKEEILSSIKNQDDNNEDERTRFITLEIFSLLSNYEESYEILKPELIKAIKRSSTFTQTIKDLILTNNKNKRDEIEASLMLLLTESDDKTRNLIRDLLNSLR